MIPKDSHRRHPFSVRMTAGLLPALALAFLCLWNSPAAADFRLCNNTASRVGIALGYKDAEGWTTEGWWNVSSRSCETLLRGTLVARFYYIYALDYDRGGEWSGQAFMCSRDKEFTIRGADNCLARGFDRTGRSRKHPGHVQFAGRIASGRAWAASARKQAMRRLRRIKILATLGPAS